MTPSFLCVPCRAEWCGENKHHSGCYPRTGTCAKCGAERVLVMLCECKLERCPECRHPEGWHEIAGGGTVILCVNQMQTDCKCKREAPKEKRVRFEIEEPDPIRRDAVNVPEQDRKTMATGEKS